MKRFTTSNMTIKILSHGIAILGLGVLIGCSPKPSDQDDLPSAANPQTTAIKARQDLMHRWKKAFNVAKQMHKDPNTFDAQTLTQQMTIINDSKQEMWRYFDDDTPNNKVNDLIQQDPAKFAQMADEFDILMEQFTQNANNATSFDDVGTAFKDVKDSCRNCHEIYKKL